MRAQLVAQHGEKRGAVRADANGSGLGAALLKKKFSDEALRRCGLFFTRDDAVLTLGAMRPRFRGRLMIPIRDHQGRIVAFTARQLELTPADDPTRRQPDITTARQKLGWEPKIELREGRERTLAWYVEERARGRA